MKNIAHNSQHITHNTKRTNIFKFKTTPKSLNLLQLPLPCPLLWQYHLCQTFLNCIILIVLNFTLFGTTRRLADILIQHKDVIVQGWKFWSSVTFLKCIVSQTFHKHDTYSNMLMTIENARVRTSFKQQEQKNSSTAQEVGVGAWHSRELRARINSRWA